MINFENRQDFSRKNIFWSKGYKNYKYVKLRGNEKRTNRIAEEIKT